MGRLTKTSAGNAGTPLLPPLDVDAAVELELPQELLTPGEPLELLVVVDVDASGLGHAVVHSTTPNRPAHRQGERMPSG